jgi:hypothetical protein
VSCDELHNSLDPQRITTHIRIMAMRKSSTVSTSLRQTGRRETRSSKGPSSGKVSAKSRQVMRETSDRFHKALSRLADR